MTSGGDRAYWNRAYEKQDDAALSWYQAEPQPSLDLIAGHGPGREASILDIGGGASRLTDALLDAGYRDLSVLDISDAALAVTRRRLGDRAGRVAFIAVDITSWTPPRRWDVWHDRAVLHFLTSEAEQAAYRRALLTATAAGSIAVLGAFAPDGPERCSGLPVKRWSAGALARFLAPEFRLLDRRRHLHQTPRGAAQSFEFAVLVRD